MLFIKGILFIGIASVLTIGVMFVIFSPLIRLKQDFENACIKHGGEWRVDKSFWNGSKAICEFHAKIDRTKCVTKVDGIYCWMH